MDAWIYIKGLFFLKGSCEFLSCRGGVGDKSPGQAGSPSAE